MRRKPQDEWRTGARIAAGYLASRSHSREMSDAIAAFMKHYNIGESAYGRAMDAMGRKVTNHRLYGHHLVADFPSDLEDIPDFILHEISDLFTNFGLPILPGQVLEDTSFYEYCSTISNNPNWSMINGFDILSGTISVFQGLTLVRKASNEEFAVESIEDLARTIGIGAVEAALAVSTANPFLLIGCILHLLSGFVAVRNDGGVIYFNRQTDRYRLELMTSRWGKETGLRAWQIEEHLSRYTVESRRGAWLLQIG